MFGVKCKHCRWVDLLSASYLKVMWSPQLWEWMELDLESVPRVIMLNSAAPFMHCQNFCRLKCHNKCTKEAPSCRISFLPSKLYFNPGYITDGHTDCVLHILCDIYYMSSSRQNSEDWICPVWHKQPCWSATRGATIWYTPQSHYEKGKTKQQKHVLHYNNKPWHLHIYYVNVCSHGAACF